MTFIPFLVLLLLLPLVCCQQNPFKFGGVFRKKEDAHLIEAFNYSINWVNTHLHLPLSYSSAKQFEPVVEILHEAGDHYALLNKACKLFKEDKIVSLFAPAEHSLISQLTRLTDTLDVPLFTVADDFSYHKLDSLSAEQHQQRLARKQQLSSSRINVFPQAQLMEAISDLILHWRWNRVIVVYVDTQRIKRLIPFLEGEPYFGIRFYFVRVENKDFLEASRKALQMGFIELKHWFLLTSTDLKVMDMELFRHNHARFIAVDAVYPPFLQENMAIFNFSDFKESVKNSWFKQNHGSKNFKMSEAAFILTPSTWQLILCSTSVNCTLLNQAGYGRKLINHIRNTTLIGLTGDLARINLQPIQHPANHNFSFRINLLGYTGRIDDIGYWEPVTDVHVNMSQDSKVQLQRNVKVSDELKPHFRVTTIMERPYVMLKKNHFEMDKNSQFEGFCIDLLEELSNDLGFTYSIHVVRDNKYGGDTGNGSWDGMIGEIMRGEADMVVAPLTANFRRAEVVDFTKPFLSLGISIIFKIPEDHQPDLFSFLNPLSLEIWACILASIFGLTIGMYLVAQVTPYEWNLSFSCCTAHQPTQLLNMHQSKRYLGPAFQQLQGCDFGPRAVSTRLLGGTWWVFTLVIVSAYTANLAAVLTVSRPHIPIRSLDDLANQSTILYGTIKDGSTMQFFQESKIGSHVRMWKQMKNKNVFVRNNREGVDKVLKENYAYLMESSSLEYEVQQNCNLTQIGGVLGSKGYGIALEKKSEWTDWISRQILLYQKRGIIEMKKTKWWRSKGASCTGVGSSVKQQRISLNLHNVSGLFVILFAGLGLSLGIVSLEFYWRRFEISQQEKTDPLLYPKENNKANNGPSHKSKKQKKNKERQKNLRNEVSRLAFQ
uniref:Uncharacterized protein n=1 Tax=Ditylenchus dipsaci TaxID=166011 RepID=A0A915DWI9_9BILA